jgi:hypothetical protein
MKRLSKDQKQQRASAVFITNIAEYDFRYTQDVVWRLERLGAASDSSS